MSFASEIRAFRAQFEAGFKQESRPERFARMTYAERIDVLRIEALILDVVT